MAYTTGTYMARSREGVRKMFIKLAWPFLSNLRAPEPWSYLLLALTFSIHYPPMSTLFYVCVCVCVCIGTRHSVPVAP
jgi:hypothetical protein